jgi:hypothetical protein
VVPERPGHPTLRILFSERQQLLGLVGEAERLAETASDYAINYRFALEEGLDPQTMTRADVGRRIPDRPTAARVKPRFSFTRAEIRTEAPATGRHDLPPGYAPASALARRDCHFLPARLEATGGLVRVVLEPDKLKGDPRPQPVDQVGHRDDFERFVLPRRSLGGWKPGEGTVLEIPASEFPDALAARFRARPHAAEAVVTPAGVFVAPGAALSPADRPRRRRVTPLRLALVALAAVGLVSGTVVSAWQDVTPPPRPVTPVAADMPANAALSMIESFARADERGAGR